MVEEIKLSAIANVRVLEQFQKLFLKLTDIYVTFIDTNGQFITSDRGLRPFCLYLAKLKLKDNCDKCNIEHVTKAIKLKKPIIYECFAGLTEILSPIIVDKKVVGAVLAGQIKTKGQKLNLDNLSQLGIKEFTKIKQLYEQIPEFTKEQIDSIAQLFFILINYIFEIEFEILTYKESNEPVDKQQRIVKEVINIVRNNYNDPNLSLETLAERLNISKFYLCRIFRKQTGFSIKGFIKKVRFKNVIELLKNPAVPIKEIPYKVGYQDVYYFYKIFKKEFDMTPASFRKHYMTHTKLTEQKSTKKKQNFTLNVRK